MEQDVTRPVASAISMGDGLLSRSATIERSTPPFSREKSGARSYRATSSHASEKPITHNKDLSDSKTPILRPIRFTSRQYRKEPRAIENAIKTINDRLVNAKPRKGLTTWACGRLIDVGGFARVYHALNISMCEWIVANQINKPDNITPGTINQEIKLLSSFSHRNIVQYLGYDIDDKNQYLYIFLEYVSGGSLKKLLAAGGPCPDAISRFFTRQIAEGLKYLHENQVIHRDLKSDNILIDEQGVCKITDFDLSRVCSSEAYDTISMMSFGGTPNWMAPEAVIQTSCSAKVDIWSLGCVVIELLTGRMPWQGLSVYQIIFQLGTGNQPNIPDECSLTAQSFIRDCLKLDKDERPTAELLVRNTSLREAPKICSFKTRSSIGVFYDDTIDPLPWGRR